MYTFADMQTTGLQKMLKFVKLPLERLTDATLHVHDVRRDSRNFFGNIYFQVVKSARCLCEHSALEGAPQEEMPRSEGWRPDKPKYFRDNVPSPTENNSWFLRKLSEACDTWPQIF